MMFNNNPNPTRRTFVKGAGAAAATAFLVGQNQLSAHAATSQKEIHHSATGKGINVLLVHGGFVDGDSWDPVISLLQASGFHVLAVQNPNTSLTDDVHVTSQALASLSGPTILVGHSYGGGVITNAGSTPSAANVKALVYIAAFGPDQGETLYQAVAKFPPEPGPSKHLIPSYRSDAVIVDPVYFPVDFMQDVDLAKAKVYAAVEKPFGTACTSQATGVPAWKRLPSWYLVSTEDRMINPDAQRFMAKRMKATISEVAASHASMLSHPDEVFNTIVTAAAHTIRR